MAVIGVQHKADVDRRLLSNSIWANCPIELIQAGRMDGGVFHFDDFIHFNPPATGVTATSEETNSQYYYHTDLGVTVLSVDDTDHGQIQVAANDAANDGHVMAWGARSGFARLGTNPEDQVWFEARFQKASVTNDALGFFLGFIEADVSELTVEAVLTDTAGEMDTTQDFVGFHNDPDDGDLLECVYQEGGANHVDVGDAITTMAAATNYKVGLRFDGQSQKLRYYVNEALVQTLSVTSSLSFPDTNHLCMVWATKSVLTAASTMNLDWWACAAVSAGS